MGKTSQSGRAREIWAVVLVGSSLLLLLSLVSYHPFDVGNAASGGREPIRNFVGPVGAWIGYLTFSTWGLASYVLMVVVGAIGVMLLLGREVPWRGKVWAGVLLLVASAVLLHLLGLEGARRALNLPSAGGFVGLFVGDFFSRLVGRAGTWISFAAAYVVALILLVNFTPSYWVALSVATVQDCWQTWREQHSKRSLQEELEEKERALRAEEWSTGLKLARKQKEARKRIEETSAGLDGGRPEPRIVDSTVRPVPVPVPVPVSAEGATGVEAKPVETKSPESKPVGKRAATKPRDESEPVVSSSGVLASGPAPQGEQYVLPPLDLLALPPPVSERTRLEDLKQNALILRATLADFDIEVEVGDVTKGPTVTLYEFYPAPGVKVEKIAALSNNIALKMKVDKVRILTPVPGKGTVGIEVPNMSTTTVYLRDILESPEWRQTKAKIPLALGRDIKGQPVIADLADMPHLLIAGATGSGKTVCVNAILATLLYRFTPEDLRLVLVDPKMVEMQHYNSLPHLVVPVVTESKKVPLALGWVIREMEKRYQIFAKVGVRNITGFNQRDRKPVGRAGTEEVDADAMQEELKIEVPRDADLVIPDKLPYIVVVIDELADLMHTVPADVEMAIARLTALARAAGIHLIIATQRPSTDVVTGVIKSNIPSRVAFQVSSMQDSRVILDANGAEKLLGKGDMLYLAGSGKLTRAQGVLVTDEEIHRIVEFIGKHAKPRWETEIHQKLQKPLPSDDETDEVEEDEELIEKCIEVIRQTNRASVSMLQRRLGIGYNRAARIMDILEERGIVGPARGAEPREILVDLNAPPPANSTQNA
ncbi:MAG: DNA translocase FtsK [Verrucomicrobiae bacterium]|nr:DNA translocase FtsK [Verrucomicrobiae bacterium]